MRKKLFFFKSFALSLVSFCIYAQNINVTGIVKDQSSELLYGVNVTVKGTTNGSTTDDKGKYSIAVSKGQSLTFSYIGYKSQDIVVGNSNVINVNLSQDANALGEVVVTALGVARQTRALGRQLKIQVPRLSFHAVYAGHGTHRPPNAGERPMG